MSKEIGETSSFFSPLEPYSNHFVLTKNSSLMGAIELSGRDPDGLTAEDHAAMCAISQSIYGALNRDITITQYFAHFDGVQVELRRRADPIADTLSQRRVAYLNGRQLSGSRIVHYFEIDPDENLNQLNVLDMLKNLGKAVFDKRSRVVLKNSISGDKMFLIELQQLDRMAAQLEDTITEVTQKWGGVMTHARQLTVQEIWAHQRFLATLDPNALALGLTEAVPEEDMDLCLSSGDIKNVQVEKMEVLKLAGVTNVYARMASVRRFSKKGGKMLPGLWAKHEKSPIRVKGNYILMTRWRPMSEFTKDLMFNRKNAALERQSLNFFAMMSGNEAVTNVEKQAGMKPAIKAKLDELGIAETLPDVWGVGSSYICIFGDDPVKLRSTSLELNASLSNARINVTWESVTIADAFRAFQPGQGRESKRDLNMPSSQFAAASLLHQSSQGQVTVRDMNYEEAAYLLQSKDGTVFHYSPFVNGRALVIGIGPIRKGKTFFKNTIATHSQKFGGLYRAIDIDPGTEPIAGIFGDKAGIFRASKSSDGLSGANPFASCTGPDDTKFKIHLLSLLKLFLAANDTAEYQIIATDEQAPLDRAIGATMALPKHMQTLSALVAHMPEKLQVKFARWVRPGPTNHSAGAGWYSYLFDNEVDAIGDLKKPMGVFNLQALKENPILLRPVLQDIIYRITNSFEDEAIRDIPKTLDIDECHLALTLEGFPEYLISRVRTWGKWYATVQLWTQSVEELMSIKGWSALRSAASTFMFFSDPEMEEGLYRSAFPFLTAGECKAIRELIPQKEAYIIQPELGISKVIVIDVEPAQRVVNTSHPREAALRDGLIKLHGFEEGLRLAVEQLEPVLVRDPEDDVFSRLSIAQS